MHLVPPLVIVNDAQFSGRNSIVDDSDVNTDVRRDNSLWHHVLLLINTTRIALLWHLLDEEVANVGRGYSLKRSLAWGI